ncbi:MAG: nitroreductase family protein [Cyclobacteriaceae bacterium]|nr:nitroreductase family protein [Cyclobacteriaceae bacterium]
MEDHKDTIQLEGHTHVRYYKESYDEADMLERSANFYKWVNDRRTVRDFSDKPISKEIIDNIVLSASTAPSGAHKQPWTFCVVSNPELKSKIRQAAEKEEQESYKNRMSDEWLEVLKPIGTDWRKPFLETAPYLIIIFKKPYDLDENGNKKNNYYVNESVGLAAGFLLTAIHDAGLIALTHTPSPMNFLSKILNRPTNERPFLLIPVGYPSEKMYVPHLKRKSLTEIANYYE